MRILVIGSGGREHALVWKINQSPRVTALFCAPGNPGIARLAPSVPLKASDGAGLLDFAVRESIDLTVVGPEQPLADGIVDLFRRHRLAIFGPTQAAAELEWSKAFAKEFMRRHAIPTAHYASFTKDHFNEAHVYLDRAPLPVVVKADGLAAGKGVVICQTRQEADAALRALTEEGPFGSAGKTVVIEEFMNGEEASVFAVCDGREFVTLAPAQDHKRILDDDQGKNTGGMGAYAPASCITPEILRQVEEQIIQPVLTGMAQEGRPYQGCLYVGLMLTPDGPKVVEFNCRFGDPETQVILPLYGGDVVTLLEAACTGSIGLLRRSGQPVARPGSSVCIVAASAGYPDVYRTGALISGLEGVEGRKDVVVFHAGTRLENGRVVTSGGRVLGVTSVTEGSLGTAIDLAYKALAQISFEGMQYRRDIGRKGLRV